MNPTPYVITFNDGKLADFAYYDSYAAAQAEIERWVAENKALDGMYSVRGLRRG